MKKLDLSIPDEWSEKEYKIAKNKYIEKKEEYHSGGFLTSGYYVKNPAAGLAEWNIIYPTGYKTWLANKSINSQWIMNELGGKVNEIIEYLNKIDKHIKFENKKVKKHEKGK